MELSGTVKILTVPARKPAERSFMVLATLASVRAINFGSGGWFSLRRGKLVMVFSTEDQNGLSEIS
jgi:hypothetical protein